VAYFILQSLYLPRESDENYENIVTIPSNLAGIRIGLLLNISLQLQSFTGVIIRIYIKLFFRTNLEMKSGHSTR
jgi:hypothetical protein